MVLYIWKILNKIFDDQGSKLLLLGLESDIEKGKIKISKIDRCDLL